MNINFNNPTIIISILLIGVVLFNFMLFALAKKMGRRKHHHPLQSLPNVVKSFGKGQSEYSDDASELNELMKKIKQEHEAGETEE